MTPTLETTHGTRLGKRCDYSGSVSTTPPSKSVEARPVYQDPASCTLVMLVGPPAVVNPPTTAHTTLTFAVGKVAHVGADSLAVGPLECTAGLLRPLLPRFATGQSISLSCRDGAISSAARLPAGSSAYAGARGPLTRVDADALTLGALTCRIGTGTPNAHAYHAGDAVDIVCRGGSLDRISPVSTAP